MGNLRRRQRSSAYGDMSASKPRAGSSASIDASEASHPPLLLLKSIPPSPTAGKVLNREKPQWMLKGRIPKTPASAPPAANVRLAYPPEPVQLRGDEIMVFLAGGFVAQIDWRQRICDLLASKPYLPPVVLVRPGLATGFRAKDAMKWEQSHLARADIISFWFPPGRSQCPVTLLEFGQWALDGRSEGDRCKKPYEIVVGAHPRYKLQDFVKLRCTGMCPLLTNLENLASGLKRAVRTAAQRRKKKPALFVESKGVTPWPAVVHRLQGSNGPENASASARRAGPSTVMNTAEASRPLLLLRRTLPSPSARRVLFHTQSQGLLEGRVQATPACTALAAIMRLAYPPESVQLRPDEIMVYLAGGLGGKVDWRWQWSRNRHALAHHLPPIVFVQPRPTTDLSAEAAMKWEKDHLARADVIAFWFPQESLCAKSLFEFGQWATPGNRSANRSEGNHGKKPYEVVVGTHPRYKRRTVIEFHCAERYLLWTDLSELALGIERAVRAVDKRRKETAGAILE